ncbi:MAG: ABC transporter substrate-binding protein [Clostridia bacterium]|nr:ABC transporter substrate-binding protein [Clostridia bacterium]NCC45210.1 ABC transporter substrate-binding protein [Clostridia bacterium]
MKKKVLAIILGAALITSMAGCQNSAAGTEADSSSNEAAESTEETASGDSAESTDTSGESYTIGISQFAEHGSLDNCREGFLEGLKEEGIEEGKNLTVKVNNADADMSIAAQISQSFVTDKVDLICAIATPSAQAAYNAAMDKDIPVIYTAVTNPTEAELADDAHMPVGAVTGTSDQLPVEAQLQMIREILPDAKTIGILYTTSEANSVYSISQYEELVGEYGFELETAGVTSTSEVSMAAADLLTKVDCLTNLTDNTVVSSLPAILNQANEKNIPVFGSEIEQVKIGCLAAEGIDYVNLGKDTGKMAAKVLKGEAKAEEMEYQLLTDSSLYINDKVAENLGITVPETMTERAVENFAEITQE